MTIRRIVLMVAAACLLLASSRAIAQAPPASSDAEHRLKALEDKMDRVLKLMEAKTVPQPATGATASAIKVTRDKVQAELQVKEQAYKELKANSPPGLPIVGGIGGATNPAIERLGKIEARRSELEIKAAEMTDQLARVEKSLREGGRNGAMHVITAMGMRIRGDKMPILMDKLFELNLAKQLAISGGVGINHPSIKTFDNQIAAVEKNIGAEKVPSAGTDILVQLNLRRRLLVAAIGDKDPRVKDVDDAISLIQKIYPGTDAGDVVKLTIQAMRDEINDLGIRIFTLENMIKAERKSLRELHAFQGKDEALSREIDGLKSTLKVLDSLLAADEAQKPK